MRIDPKTNGIVTTIAIRGGPTGVASGAAAVWVTTQESRGVVRVDPRTNRAGAVVPVAGIPDGIDAEDKDVWVTVHET